MFSRGVLSVALFALVALVVALPAAQATPTNLRLTNDNGSNGGYVSDYTMVTGTPYTDAFLTACSQSRGRQNEPANVVAVLEELARVRDTTVDALAVSISANARVAFPGLR